MCSLSSVGSHVPKAFTELLTIRASEGGAQPSLSLEELPTTPFLGAGLRASEPPPSETHRQVSPHPGGPRLTSVDGPPFISSMSPPPNARSQEKFYYRMCSRGKPPKIFFFFFSLQKFEECLCCQDWEECLLQQPSAAFKKISL